MSRVEVHMQVDTADRAHALYPETPEDLSDYMPLRTLTARTNRNPATPPSGGTDG